jgi:hypothetical protein
MTLENIPFAEYLKLNETAQYIYTYSYKFGFLFNRAVNHLHIIPLLEQPFGAVKDYQQMFNESIDVSEIPRIIALFINLPLRELYQLGVVEVFQTFAFIREEMEVINNAEMKMLHREPTEKELKADSERFEIYGVYPQLRNLAGKDFMRIKEVREMPYNVCFLELCYQKDEAEFQQDYAKVK